MSSNIGESGSTPGTESDLVGLIYEAAADASWQRLLDAYTQAVGARRGCLVLNSSPLDGAVIHWSNWPDRAPQLLADRFIAEDIFQPARDGHPEGAIRVFDLSCISEAFQRSGAHREFDMKQRFRYALSGIFFRSADACSMIIAVRAEEDGPFFEPELALLRPLMPHLRRATLLHNEIISLRSRLAALTTCLDRSPYPLLLTTTAGRVMYANPALNDAARLRGDLSISSGSLMLTSHRHHIEFMTALESVTRKVSALAWLELRRPSNGSEFVLLLFSVPCPGDGHSGLGQSAVAILIVDRDARPELDTAILREVFSLTPAEARVAGKLGGGRSAVEIAEELGTSVETVRTHIRRVLSKTATTRQAELMSLLVRTTLFSNFLK